MKHDHPAFLCICYHLLYAPSSRAAHGCNKEAQHMFDRARGPQHYTFQHRILQTYQNYICLPGGDWSRWTCWSGKCDCNPDTDWFLKHTNHVKNTSSVCAHTHTHTHTHTLLKRNLVYNFNPEKQSTKSCPWNHRSFIPNCFLLFFFLYIFNSQQSNNVPRHSRVYKPFNFQIKFVILLTVNHTILMMLVQRI